MGTPSLIHVEVTKDDIANGIREDPCKCPVALAIRRTIGTTDFVTVGGGEICIGNFDQRYAMPDSVDLFVFAFDDGETVEPFSFDLSEMDPPLEF